MQLQQQLNRRALLFLLILIAAPIVSFWPGTTGDFLVDDFANLAPIQSYGGVRNMETFKAYVFSGVSGPTGRPISLASFLIDAQEWPAHPYFFKRTSIFIHTLNGVLLFAVILKLFQVMGRRDSSALNIAFFAAALWAIHPLNTSTVLYIIQRMTELSALFTLAGIWCYLHGRQKLFTQPGPAYLWMSAGIVAFGLLATLSKETGVLLPFFIAAIELTLLRQLPKPKYWFHWSIPMIGGPIALLLANMTLRSINSESSYTIRDFTMAERLMSEPRILLDYLGKIVFPIGTPTLNADDIEVSKGLFAPLTTLPAIIAINALIILAFVYCKRFSVLAFAVLWFMAGHLLESTVLPLELYFEHRNYLPMIGPIIALAYYLDKLLEVKRKKVIIWVGVLLGVMSVTSMNHSYTWGDHSRLIETWAKEQPKSVRAQVLYSLQAIRDVDYSESLAVYNQVKSNLPENLGMDILYTDIVCINNKLTPDWFNTLLYRAEYTHIDQYVQQSLNQLSSNIFRGYCKQLSLNGLQTLVRALLNNKVTKPFEQRDAVLQMLIADVYLRQDLPLEALEAMDESFRISPRFSLALQQAVVLAQGKQYDAALIQLNKAEAIDRLRPRLMPSRINEVKALRAKIKNRDETDT
ncbi:hypothetical protein ACFL2V_13195 [Pseudomonadota bacterium]